MNIPTMFENPRMEMPGIPDRERKRLLDLHKRSARIRVMHVIRYLAFAGTEHGIMKVVNRLDRRVFEPSICCTVLAREEAKRFLEKDVNLIVLNENESGKNLSLILRLRKLFQKEKIDIVHSHNWSTFPHAVIAAWMAGVPVVIHGEHGRDEDRPVRKWPKAVFLRVMKSFVSHFAAVSDNIADDMESEWKLPSWMIRRIPNGVDTGLFRPGHRTEEIRRKLGYSSGDLVIGIVGGLRKIKNHEMLFEAFRLVREELPNSRLSVVGGLANEGRKRELAEKAKMLGVSDFVHFLGERTDIPEMMAAFDIYINSSLYEGMSNTILEAMASGKPVVATRVGGNPKIVDDEVTGRLVASNDSVSMSRAIIDIHRTPSCGAAMGRKGREKVESEHSLSVMVRLNEDVYLDNFARFATRSRLTAGQMLRVGGGHILEKGGISKFVKRFRPAGVTFVTYHRVLPARLKAVTPGQRMITDERTFESQMKFFSSKFNLVSVEQAIRMLRREEPLAGNSVAVTFDDGYRDNYIYAYPILRKMKAPFSIFLATENVDTGESFWWDKISNCFLEALEGGLKGELLKASIHWPDRIRKKLGKVSVGDNGVIKILDDIVQDINGMGRKERERILADIYALAERSNFPSRERNILSWEEINEMKTAGGSFHNHTDAHVFLDEIGEEEAEKEVMRASERIQSMTGVLPVAFAYPRGRSDAEAKNIISRQGLLAGFTTCVGHNLPGCNMFELKRVDTGYLAINDTFAEFLYWLRVMY